MHFRLIFLLIFSVWSRILFAQESYTNGIPKLTTADSANNNSKCQYNRKGSRLRDAKIRDSLMYNRYYTKAIQIRTDNDFYVNPFLDEYYSNGLYLNFRFLKPSTDSSFNKSIYSFELGQAIYTPSKDYKASSSRQDRPFAAYLFGSFSFEKYRKDKQFFQAEIQVGILGPSAFGEQSQSFLHRTFGMAETLGWDYQIQDQIGLNINLQMLRSLFYAFNRQMDFNIFSKGELGTVADRIHLGFLSRIGFNSLNSIQHTALLQSNIGKENTAYSGNEVYFFLKPSIAYVFYDATLSGSLFKDKSPVVFDALPIQTSLEVGLEVASKRFNVSYSIFFLSQKPDNDLAKGHQFGRIELSYRFN